MEEETRLGNSKTVLERWSEVGAIVLLALGSLFAAAAHFRQKPGSPTVAPGSPGTASSKRGGDTTRTRWSFGGPLPGATPFDDALVRKLRPPGLPGLPASGRARDT